MKVWYCEEWPTLNGRRDRTRPRVKLCKPSATARQTLTVCDKCGGRVVSSAHEKK